VEFPGCFATGATGAEALQNLESVGVDWINAALAQGQNIPDPMESNEYSGKLVLRMPSGLHRRAALWAHREGVSLNQFINTSLAEAVGERARPAIMYPVAQIQTLTTTTINAFAGVTGTGVVVGLTDNSANRLSTGTNADLLRLCRDERCGQEQTNAKRAHMASYCG
jgi:antitoxin HicB